MSNFHQSSMISMKILLISTTIISISIALKLYAPPITDLTISATFISWLKPPYLYLVINFIIITIVASSKLQSKFEHFSTSPPLPLPESFDNGKSTISTHSSVHESFNNGELTAATHFSVHESFDNGGLTIATHLPVHESINNEEFAVATHFSIHESFNNGELAVATHLPVQESFNNEEFAVATHFPVHESFDNGELAVATHLPVHESFDNKEFTTATHSPVQEFKILKTVTPVSKGGMEVGKEYLVGSAEKPPVASRFGHHRRIVKASPEGGKTALKVSKPRRQDTLESTWKTITEGRPMPLARHLKKSDMWETHGRHHHNVDTEVHKMGKSATFSEPSETMPPLRRTHTPGKLKKEPSLGQDELNKRVEAFIKKFNEEMRLQRQESLNKYMEMINRGAH